MTLRVVGAGVGRTGTLSAAIAAFERRNAQVREAVPAERLIEWQPGDGWEPLCRALGLPVPDEPFPRRNTREEWRARQARSSESR